MFNLKNKTIIVAGGNGLIGSAIVERMREAGGKVYSLDIKDADINIKLSCDINYKILFNEYPPDIFVNASYPDDANHLHVFYVTSSRYCQWLLKNNRTGVLLNLSSIYSKIMPFWGNYYETKTKPPQLPYIIDKGGIDNLTKFLACQYGGRGIRCNTINPGGIYDSQDQKFIDSYEYRTPLCRMAKPDDIAYLCVFLASDEASYITGQNIFVDGGITAL